MYPLVVSIEKLVSANVAKNVFGFDLNSNIGKVRALFRCECV
jgi:hypothetical protein